MTEKLFSFGVIADIQYADLDDGTNYSKTRTRYYRNALKLLNDAVNEWESSKDSSKLSFVLNLGDTVDGFNTKDGNQESALAAVIKVFDTLSVPVHHTSGNHDFYNFSRSSLLKNGLNSKHLGDTSLPDESEEIENGLDPSALDSGIVPAIELPESNACYYHFSPYPGFRVVILDSFEFSLLGYSEDDPIYKEIEKLLRKFNSNEDLNSPIGLEGNDARFVKFNGGVSHTQLRWLHKVLTHSDKCEETVIIASHQPILAEATEPICLTWNYNAISHVISQHSCVALYLAGHDHDGGTGLDEQGVRHIVFRGVVEVPPGENAFANVDVYKDRIVVEGIGRMEALSTTVELKQ